MLCLPFAAYSGSLKSVTDSRNDSAIFANSETERAVSNVAVVVCDVISCTTFIVVAM